MHNYLKYVKRKFLLMSVLLLFVLTAGAQVFQNGIRKGMIKVKFSAEMTSTLSNIQVSASSGRLTTGIASIDAVAQTTSATNMYRLFPYDAMNESRLQKHGLHLWYVVEVNGKTDTKNAVQQFKQLKGVVTAEEEHEKIVAPTTATIYTPTTSTLEALPFNDPMLKDQWHYHNTGQSGFGNADINLFNAWTKTAGANNIIVSVHDQGVDVNHTDLKENIWTNLAELNGSPGVDDDHNGYVDDIHGYNFDKNSGAIEPQFHATHVAGTIAAVNNNGIGVSGIAGGTGHGDGVKIMSLQIFGEASTEKTYIYAANNGAVISQNSWGYTQPDYYDQSVLDAIDYFIAEAGNYPGSPMKGGIVIFAAGNSNYDAHWYPGYYPNVLSVSSLGPEWKKAAYSNFGTWVEVAAPGGDQQYGTKSGVLSTYPKDQYAYLQGTSMACPHVSGIAALALASRDHQLTNTELWNKLITGIVDIDQFNPDYIGKLGSGAIDAALVIQNDQHLAPMAINDLTVTGVAQEFADLTWTVPADNDDFKPVTFELYYHTQPITSSNLNAATKVVIKNWKNAGDAFSYEIDGLLGVTTYYFAVTSTDRWGNISSLSNIASQTTNEGPSIAVDESSQSIEMNVDGSNSFSAAHDITILNQASGILRWDHVMRQTAVSLSYDAASLHYPKPTKLKSASQGRVSMRSAHDAKSALKSTEPSPTAYTPIVKSYYDFITNLIGDTDTTIANSAAARFYVTEPEGFNLTDVQMDIKHNPAKGPVVVEVYKGSSPTNGNRVYAQEHYNYSADEAMAYITLNEQLYFETGSTFWVVFHVPSGNLFPLGIGYEKEETSSTNCFISFDVGTTWAPLEEALNSKYFAWAVTAASYNPYLGSYLTLEPGAGDVQGNDQTTTTLTADGNTLINGTYSANLVLTSNDALHKELRVPVSLTVSGHESIIKHIDIADFGSVFIGGSKTLELALQNVGYGNFNSPEFSFTGTAFEIDGYTPWQIQAREEVIVRVKFHPTDAGNINDVLTISDGSHSYRINLFGVGTLTSKISVTPASQTKSGLTIGNVMHGKVTVKNTGAYPLKYFIPGHDAGGVSESWPSGYHKYGYRLRTSYATEANPIAFDFKDISATGTDVTGLLKRDEDYAPVDMGFDFPYYGVAMQKLYIANHGFTTFDNTVRPLNVPSLGNHYNPKGYISPLGGFFSYSAQGKVFYQVEADRVIIQFDNVWDGVSVGESITAQMVLFANGDIRFYYANMGFSAWNQATLNILIEDLNQSDGIMVHNYEHPISLYSGLALGFDYPGPNIITNVLNGSGILTPGDSSVVDIELSTASLTEGTFNRYVNFISNDPANPQTNALIQLNIDNGGTPLALISTDTIAFGNVFQGAAKTSTFTLKNTGSASVDITNMAFVNGKFAVVGEQPASVAPGLYKSYEVDVPASTLGALEDWLSINYADGSHDTIYVAANIVVAPNVSVDLSLLQQTLAYGDSVNVPFSMANTGLGTLEVMATGKQWLSFDASAPSDITYTYEKQNSGGVYQWFDIHKTGTQLPFFDLDDMSTFWRTLTLPFPIEYYGVKYNSFKVGDNGIISFEEDPKPMIDGDGIPSPSHPGACIMPYWTFSGFNTVTFPKEDVGIFYQYFDDKIIITWSYFINNFGGMGDPVSAQIIFYKNGTMKFQYKVEDGGMDLTSRGLTVIGLQKDSTTGVMISNRVELDHGQGLAYVILPAKKFSIAPGSTLNGQIELDARTVYGGVYNETLKIHTNVPGKELLEKPIGLTVTGEAQFTAPDSVDFGSKMVVFEYGSPVVNAIPLNFTNNGAAPYQITWAQMADGMQGLSLQLYMLADGWFGPEWRWVDIAEAFSPWVWQTPVFTIMPGDQIAARAVFSPSVAGDFTDELVLTTSIGEQRIVLKGSAFEPPVLEIDKTPITVLMNATDEIASRSIDFNNINGLSELKYEISIDYSRAASSIATTENMASSTQQGKPLSVASALRTSGATITSSYNRILKYTQKDAADALAGTGGGSPITIATKYNAGSVGFNLSHVETWFRTETLDQGLVNVEIRAGGTTIANAVAIGQGTLQFTGSGNDNTGAWAQIALDKAVGIYPNEDFYVIVTLPSGIARPAGVVNGEETVHGRYYYEDEGVWYDIQTVPGFENSGWLMYAAEQTAANLSWLSITSDLSGTVVAGEATAASLQFDGSKGNRGDQVANVVFKSNDPYQSIVKIPVKLHVNEAPRFMGVHDGIQMLEKDTVTIRINVTDAEGNSFTVQSAQTYKGVTSSFADGILTIVMTPDYGDAGYYQYAFVAKDEFNAERQLVLPVAVMHANRAPEYIASTDPFVGYRKGIQREFALTDLFSDPDGDAMTFTATSSVPGIVEIFSSATSLIVRGIAVGQTNITLTVEDINGGQTIKTLPVFVDVVMGDINITSDNFYAWPNPTHGKMTITIPSSDAGSIRILNIMGDEVVIRSIVPDTTDYQFNIEGEAPGLYLVELNNGVEKKVIRIVKK